MSLARAVYALAVLAVLACTAACLPRAGNDVSLMPVVHHGALDTSKIVVGSGHQIAAFAVYHLNYAWELRFLGASDSAGALVPTVYVAPQTAPARVIIPVTQPSVMMDVCSTLVPVVDANGQTTMASVGSCTARDRAVLEPPPMPAVFPSRRVPGTVLEYVVLVASSTPLSDEEWEALADSLQRQSILGRVPGRLGRLAFDSDSSTHWAAVLTMIPRDGPALQWVGPTPR